MLSLMIFIVLSPYESTSTVWVTSGKLYTIVLVIRVRCPRLANQALGGNLLLAVEAKLLIAWRNGHSTRVFSIKSDCQMYLQLVDVAFYS